MQTLRLAGCIISNSSNEILLIHRNKAGRAQWGIPGGKAEGDEELAAAAIREAAEETGLQVQINRQVGSMHFTQPNDERRFAYTWFSVDIVSGTPRVMEPDEHDDIRYFGLDQLSTMGSELSPNTRNFLQELAAGRIHL